MIVNRVLLKRAAMYCSGLLVVMLLASAWVWLQLPVDARLPVHFGLDGTVNRYGSKAEALLVLPGMMLLMVLVLAALPWIEPRQRHLAQSLRPVLWILIGTCSFMAAIHAAMLAQAMGFSVPVGPLVGGLMGLMWMVLGNAMGKLRSNFFVGIRTPWTLSSELSWQKTHRLCGKLFFAVGAMTLLLAVFGSERVMLAVLLGGTLLSVIVALGYSWWVWREDPQREQSGD